VQSGADVCLLGRTVAKNLFVDGQSPIGKVIRVNNLTFLVDGVLEAKGQSLWGQDQDDIVMVPYSTVMKKLIGINWLHFMDISATSMQTIPAAEQQIEALLRQRHW
jgi:putative ABC transport system permease protein